MASVALLVIDDFALRQLTSDQSDHRLEVIEVRVQNGATILTSHLPVSHWARSPGLQSVQRLGRKLRALNSGPAPTAKAAAGALLTDGVLQGSDQERK